MSSLRESSEMIMTWLQDCN